MTGISNTVDRVLSVGFGWLGEKVAGRPWSVIVFGLIVAASCGSGFLVVKRENRPEKLWVPQDTRANVESKDYGSYYPPVARLQNYVITSNDGGNALEKDTLVAALKLHEKIATTVSTTDGTDYVLADLCVPGFSCQSSSSSSSSSNNSNATEENGSHGVCDCLVTSIFGVWDYDVTKLENDTDPIATLGTVYYSTGGGSSVDNLLGGSVTLDEAGRPLSAEAISVTYLLTDRGEVVNGAPVDEINEAWEKTAFLDILGSHDDGDDVVVETSYFSERSFEDEFGDAIGGDLLLVQISYIVVFIFLGGAIGSRFLPGPGSRWTMTLAALVMVTLAVLAGFGLSAAFGIFYGPVQSVLPFVLLGIGVDDVFVICNAFDRELCAYEMKVTKENPGVMEVKESDSDLVRRASLSLARAGASITVTSLTDLVAFAISSSSALPALASFCAYASVCIFFLWSYACTFFTACLVIDEKRQRDDRREFLCCTKRRSSSSSDISSSLRFSQRDSAVRQSQSKFDDHRSTNIVSAYFEKVHSPIILSRLGKIVILVIFSGLLAYGVYGATNLNVEDTERNFIPQGSYLKDWIDATDEYFPSDGDAFLLVFENSDTSTDDSSSLYGSRDALADLHERLSGLSGAPHYIVDPGVNGESPSYRNVIQALRDHLSSGGGGNVTLGEDGWPTSRADFDATLIAYVRSSGAKYASDVSTDEDDDSVVRAVRVSHRFVRMFKETVGGKLVPDSNKQIKSMDSTRDLVDGWSDDTTLRTSAFVYSYRFIAIEGFKALRKELWQNVGAAIAAVAVIVLCTMGNALASFLVTINVAFCVVEILGFLPLFGIVIDSVSVINIVLAVGLSVDYSAHVAHGFIAVDGPTGEARVVDALTDIGAAVLSGAFTTFLAVFVLLFSSSYVFVILSTQFALTVGLGVLHGLVLLPVLLAIFQPKPYASATQRKEDGEDDDDEEKDKAKVQVKEEEKAKNDDDFEGEKDD